MSGQKKGEETRWTPQELVTLFYSIKDVEDKRKGNQKSIKGSNYEKACSEHKGIHVMIA